MASGSSTGYSPIGKALHDLNVFLFEKNKKVMYVVALIVIPALTFFVFNYEANNKTDVINGADQIREIIARMGSGSGGGLDFGATKDFVQMRESINSNGNLGEGAGQDFVVEANADRVIEKIDITLTWTDEDSRPGIRLRRYENEPDSFRLTLTSPDSNLTSFGEKDDGRIEGEKIYTQEEMAQFYGLGNFTIGVTLMEAGNWVPNIGFGFMEIPDTENDFSINVEIVYWAPPIKN